MTAVEHPETLPGDGSVRRALVSEGAVYALVEMGLQGLSVAVLPAFFFFLSFEEFGVITWALVISQATSALATLGLDFSLMRFYYTWDQKEREEMVAAVTAVSVAWSAALAAGGAAFFWLAGSAASWPYLIGAWAGLLLGLRNIPVSVLRVAGAVRAYAGSVLGGAAVQVVTQIALVASGLGPSGYMIGYAAGAVVAAALASRSAREHVHRRGPSWRIPRDVARFTSRVFPATAFNRLIATADRIALFGWQDLSTLGLYGAASRLTTPIKIVSGGLKLALVPAMSRGEAAREDQDRLFAELSRLLLISMLVIGSGLALATWFVRFTPWGEQWEELQRIVGLLLVAQLLSGMAYVGQVGFYFSDVPQAATYAAGTNAVVLFVALSALVPAWGARGAAVAAVLGALASLLVVISITARAAGHIRPWPRLLSIAATFGPVVAAPWLFATPIQLVVFAGASMAYALLVFGEVRHLRKADGLEVLRS